MICYLCMHLVEINSSVVLVDYRGQLNQNSDAQVRYCDHNLSVCLSSSTFHIFNISSEKTVPILTKLGMNYSYRKGFHSCTNEGGGAVPEVISSGSYQASVSKYSCHLNF